MEINFYNAPILAGFFFVILFLITKSIKTKGRFIKDYKKVLYQIITSYVAGMVASHGISIIYYGYSGSFIFNEAMINYRSYFGLFGLVLIIASIIGLIYLLEE